MFVGGMMAHSIGFVKSYRDYNKIKDLCDIFICFDEITFTKIRKKEKKCYFYDSFITRVEGEEATKYMLKLIENWHILDKKDISMYKGIPIGKLFEREIFTKFGLTFKKILAFQKIIYRFSPNEVYYFKDSNFDNGDEILKKISEFSKFKLIIYNSNEPESKYSGQDFRIEDNILKILSNFVVFGLYRILWPIRLLHRIVQYKKQHKIRLFAYVNSNSMWDIWLNDKEVRSRITLIFPSFAPPRDIIKLIKLFLSGAEIFYIKKYKNNNKIIKDSNELKRKFELLFANKEWRKRFIYNGIDYSNVFINILADIVFKKLDDLLMRYYSYKQQLKKLNLDYLITKHDYDEDWQLIVRVAQQLGIKTFVITHGITVTKELLVNQIAEFIVVYGEGMKENFVNDNVDSNRIVIIGNPFFDDYFKIKVNNHKNKQNSYNRILILQHPSAIPRINSKENSDLKYIQILKKFLKSVECKEIIFKIHPGLQRKEYFEYLLNELQLDWEIVKNRDIKDLIKNSDIVIGPASTAAMEALILGKDYYYVNLEPMNYLPPFDGEFLPMYRNLQDLKKNFNKVEIDKKFILKKFCNITGNERYGHFAREIYRFFINLHNSGINQKT